MKDHFLAIWRRALNQPGLHTLTPDLVESWLASRGVAAERIEELDVGAFRPTPCIVVTVGSERACFPKVATKGDSKWEIRRACASAPVATSKSPTRGRVKIPQGLDRTD